MRTFVADPVSEPFAEHGEGPRWDAARHELVSVDVTRGTVHRHRLDQGRLHEVRSYAVGAPVGAANPIAGGAGWLLAARLGFMHLAQDGTTTMLLQLDPAAEDDFRMNDAVCDPSGRLVAGVMAYDMRKGSGRVVSADLDGSVRTLIEGTTIANGTAWDAEGETMYWADSGAGTLSAFRYDLATGRLGQRRQLLQRPAQDGVCDGIAIDDEGCVWAALWGGRSVIRVSPDGELLATVEVPVDQPSAVAFAGSTLLITSSQQGLDAAELAGQPLAGAVFGVDVGICGPPVSAFQGVLPRVLAESA